MELGEKLKNHRIEKVCRRNVIPDAVLFSIRFVLLLSSTTVLLIVALSAYFSHFTFLGCVLLLAICIGYVLWINLQYMNRTFVKKNTDD